MIWFFVAVLGLFFFFIKKKNEEVVFGEKEYQDWKNRYLIEAQKKANIFGTLIPETFEFDKTFQYLKRVLIGRNKKSIILVDVLDRENFLSILSLEINHKGFPSNCRFSSKVAFESDVYNVPGVDHKYRRKLFHYIEKFKERGKKYSDLLGSVFGGVSFLKGKDIVNFSSVSFLFKEVETLTGENALHIRRPTFNEPYMSGIYQRVFLSFLPNEENGDGLQNFFIYYNKGKNVYVSCYSGYYKFTFESEEEVLFFLMLIRKMDYFFTTDYDKRSF